jgi:hypothetical protein
MSMRSLSFRASFRAQRDASNWKTEAYLDFGELVLGLKREDLYAEAVAVLNEFGGGEPFPASQYRWATFRALTCDAAEDRKGARLHAEKALAAAARAESPFRYHRKLGLVRFVDPEVLDQLRALCAA